jgi:hypothetical protein
MCNFQDHRLFKIPILKFPHMKSLHSIIHPDWSMKYLFANDCFVHTILSLEERERERERILKQKYEKEQIQVQIQMLKIFFFGINNVFSLKKYSFFWNIIMIFSDIFNEKTLMIGTGQIHVHNLVS